MAKKTGVCLTEKYCESGKIKGCGMTCSTLKTLKGQKNTIAAAHITMVWSEPTHIYEKDLMAAAHITTKYDFAFSTIFFWAGHRGR